MRHRLLTSPPDVATTERWNIALATLPYATAYISPAYFTDPYVSGERFAFLAENETGEIDGVVTGIVDGRSVSSGLFSRPQMICRSDEAAAVLIAALREFADERSLALEFCSWEPLQGELAGEFTMRESGDETSVVLIDLSAGADAVFAGFSQTRRNEVRRGLKQGIVEVKELETDAELDQLYEVYVDWNRRKGNFVDAKDKMIAAAAMRDTRRIFIAKAEGRVIAGSFYRYVPGGMVEYAANFSMPEFQRLRPNDLIGWHAIQWASQAGCRWFSMGGSHLFLRRFGGEIKRTYRYTHGEGRFGFAGLTENVRGAGAAAFRRLPVNVQAGVRRMLAR
jgi:hypothetical protein